MIYFDHKKPFFVILILLSTFSTACKSGTKEMGEKTQDSVEQTEMEQVDQMILNQDSLIKEEEKKIMEKYGH